MVSASIVVHDNTTFLRDLLASLSSFQEISEIIVRFNLRREAYQDIDLASGDFIKFFFNDSPLGFGKNHNLNFRLSKSDFFCVLNPDLIFGKNPFPSLLRNTEAEILGAISPVVLDLDGDVSDHARNFRCLKNFILGEPCNAYTEDCRNGDTISVDSIAGMFMLIPRYSYELVNGFDEKFFLYYEDTDLCRRLHKENRLVAVDLLSKVTHHAQRKSHSSAKFFFYHLVSFIRYYLKHRDFLSVRA